MLCEVGRGTGGGGAVSPRRRLLLGVLGVSFIFLF